MVEILFALGGALVVLVWQEILTRMWPKFREKLECRDVCNHQWGDIYEVRFAGGRRGAMRFFQKRCLACDQIQDVNQDGSDYKPTYGRKEEH